MSQFRLFCIVAFVAMGLFSAAGNQGFLTPVEPQNIMPIGFLCGCFAITMFGKRCKP